MGAIRINPEYAPASHGHDLRVVTNQAPSATTAANSLGTYPVSLAVPQGYTATAVWARTFSSGLVIVGAYMASSTTANVQVRNVTANAITAQPEAWALCVPTSWLS